MQKVHRKFVFPDGERYPIFESKRAGMVLLTTAADAALAERHDPYRCVLAQCAIRTGAEKAFIAGTVAYIVMPMDGELCAVKFQVPERTRAAINLFDEKGIMPPGGFELIALKNGQTQKGRKAINANRKPQQEPKRRNRSHALRTYRHLTGHVQTREDD